MRKLFRPHDLGNPPLVRPFLLALGLAAGLALNVALVSQTLAGLLPGRTGLGLERGLIKLHDGSWDYSNVDRWAGLSLQRELGHGWQGELALRNGYVRAGVTSPGDRAGWTTASAHSLYTVMTQPMVGVKYLFATEAPLTPFLGAGLGLTSWKVINHPAGNPGWFAGGDAVSGYDINRSRQPLEGTNLTLELSLGARWRLTSRLDLHARALYQVMQGNDRDNIGLSSLWGPDHADANRSATSALVGLSWWFGNHDADGDGVPDDRDLCPHQAEDKDGYNDLDGCPDPDNDHDGVPDELDHCPFTPPGTPVDQYGCPIRNNPR